MHLYGLKKVGQITYRGFALWYIKYLNGISKNDV